MLVSSLQWLLALHVTGAFLFLGGTVAAGVLGLLAQRAGRPSEVALFLGLARWAVVPVVAGAVLTFALGLALVHRLHLSYGSFWVAAAIVLVVLASAAGSKGGRRDAETRRLAEQLARDGDRPSDELRARLRDPLTLALSRGAGAAVVAILALMMWKPGS